MSKKIHRFGLTSKWCQEELEIWSSHNVTPKTPKSHFKEMVVDLHVEIEYLSSSSTPACKSQVSD